MRSLTAVSSPLNALNNYDYFTEIEKAFVRRRGRNLLLSPVDWQLMETWEKEGIPLKIVLATIEDIFDQIRDDPKRAGSVRTLSYCKDAVESRYRSWLESRVGDSDTEPDEAEVPEGPSPAEFESLAARLETVAGESHKGIAKVLEDAAKTIREIASVDTGDAESELERLDEMIDSALLRYAEGGEIDEAKKRVSEEIGGRRASMGNEAYERTEALMVRKQLRESSGIPRLGLFYL